MTSTSAYAAGWYDFQLKALRYKAYKYTMDFYQQPRYRLNKLFLSLVGLWPYQSTKESRFFLCLPIFCTGSLVFTQIRAVAKDYRNPDTIIAAVAPFVVDLACVIKVMNNVLNEKKVRQILVHIEKDFNAEMGPERKVFRKCVDNGRTFSLLYAATLYSAMVCYLILPSAPRIAVTLGLANMSTRAQFPFPVDHNIDPEENFIYIQTHVCLGVFFVVSMIVSVDCMFVVAVQHACGIFSAVGYRLERVAEAVDLNIQLYPHPILDEAFSIVVDCIKKHNEAIDFVELVDSTYSWSFLLITGMGMVALSFSLFEMAECLANGRMEMVGIHILFAGGQLMHLFFESYFSQRVTDHSFRVYEALSMIQWYKTSIRTRKLLNFMILRSTLPCELKAGSVYIMSIKNFSTVVRTSMSYFTVLSSAQ